jgi:hypothetical protein
VSARAYRRNAGIAASTPLRKPFTRSSTRSALTIALSPVAGCGDPLSCQTPAPSRYSGTG